MPTLTDLAESLAFLVASARQAADDGNDARYAHRHAQINARLDAYEALAIAHLDPHPPNRLAERAKSRLFG